MNVRVVVILFGLAGLLPQCFSQGTSQPLLVTFDGSPIQAPGTAALIQQYNESGMTFAPNSSGNGFVRRGGGVSFFPENGTTYLQAGLGSTLLFSAANGSLFDLLSVDLAEYSTVVPNAVTVHFIGYHADGSTVTMDLTTDGIIDGTGPLADFQTFGIQGWNGLTRVEIPTAGWSLDNLVVRAPGVPEPTTGALLLFGAGALWFLRARNRRASRS